jgi:UDP:flavonoid glycosyltransferase YjiC (YdhE family)
MRILFTSYPQYGHINPMMPLALAAQRTGHDVVFATGADMASYLKRWGLEVWSVGPTHAQASAKIPPSFRYFTDTAEPRAVDLLAQVKHRPPDLIIADEFELAAAIAATACPAELVIHGLGLMIPPEIWEPAEPDIAELYRRWGVPGGVATVRNAPYLEATPPMLRLDGERLWHRAQPLRPAPGPATAGERLPAAIDRLPYPDTIHLTLGTLFHDRHGVLQTAIDGLRSLRANLVVTTGPGSDPARFGPEPAHVLIEPYVPHALLLPRCRLVVSQGGAGIMLGSLAHGLPQLMLPQGADQFLNAQVCTNAGAALALEPQHLSPGNIATAALRLIDEPHFAVAATTIAQQIRAMPGAEQVLTGLVAHARERHVAREQESPAPASLI